MTTMICCHGNDIGDGPISGRTFDEERALYNLHGAVVENCRFSGPADGESALKECRDVTVRGCYFDLRYPMWHADGFSMGGVQDVRHLSRSALVRQERDGFRYPCERGQMPEGV